MSKFMQQLKNTAYQQSSAQLLLFFMSWGIWWSFFQLWLSSETRGLGFNGSEIGTIYSVNSAVTLVLMLVYGTAQDKLRTRRNLVIGIAVLMSLTGPFFMWVYWPLLQSESLYVLGVGLGAIFIGMAFVGSCPLFEALAERMSRKHNFEYGQARAWGSFGYAIVALLAGFNFTINPAINFWMASAFGILLLLILVFWKEPVAPRNEIAEEEVENTTPSVKEMVSVLKVPALWVVIVLVFFTWTFYTVFDQQMFPQFYTSLFSDSATGERTYGVLNSVQVFVEALMMGIVPIYMRKVGVKNTLMTGFAVMALRILGCAVFADPVTISFVKMFHALEVPLCILPIFRYFTLHFPTKISATLYMVGFQIASQVGNVVMSPILGSMRDRLGFQPTFYVISGIVLVSAIFAWFALKGDKEQVEGDPFYRDSELKELHQ